MNIIQGAVSGVARASRGLDSHAKLVALSFALLAVASPACGQTACDADLDGDGVVSASDLAGLLGAWGPCGDCGADLDRDGVVGAMDLAVLLGLWGETCSPLPWATVLEFAPDPAIVTHIALRDAIVATGLPWRVRDDASQIEMLLVPPGTFNMGCSPSNQYVCGANENPVHVVALTNAFYLGRFEVTQSQWTAVVGSNPSYFKGPSYPDAPNRPVENVSWNMVQGFLSATSLRLPTEAEWEYACRAGTTTAFHSMPGYANGTNDDALVGNIAWHNGNAGGQTHVVGGKAANALGFHDMSGNVWEWVADWYSYDYYASSPAVNPAGPATGTQKVARGGSWSLASGSMRSSSRAYAPPGGVNGDGGFRVARAP